MVDGNPSQSEQQHSRTNRRTLLKTGAVGLTGLVAGSGLASAASGQTARASDVHTTEGTLASPVSADQRRELRYRAIEEYEQRNGTTFDAVPASKPKTDSGEVVAYAYGIDADGVPRSYVGVAAEDTVEPHAQSGRAESLIHDRFATRAAEVSNTLQASEQQVTTTAGGTVSGTENMQQVHSNKQEYAKDPYGVVGATFYWLRDTLDSTGGDVHSFHSPSGFEPGHQAFKSGYKNEWGRVFHRWNKSQMGNTDVDYGQWNPYGTKSGSSSTGYSLSVSAGWMTASVSAGVNWSYSQPNVEVVDESSAYNEYNQWQLKVNANWSDDTRENFVGFQPSSAASMDYWDASLGRRDICENEVKGQFSNGSDAQNLWSKATYYLE